MEGISDILSDYLKPKYGWNDDTADDVALEIWRFVRENG